MRTKLILLSLACLALCTRFLPSAHAAPSANGPTGLWNVPSAAAIPQGQYNVFFNHHSRDNKLVRLGANIGTGAETPLELGFTVFNPEVGKTRTVFNLKSQLLQETGDNPAVAFGAIDLTNEIDRTLYVSITKRLDVPQRGKKPHPLFGTIGAGSNDSDGVLDGIFFGLTYLASDTSAILLEHDAEDLNLGLRHHISPYAVLDVGSVNNDLYIGLSYNVTR